MPKWVAEGVLQKYFVERHERYKFKGQKIVSARLNQPFDTYPDIFCVLEDKREVPAEVEWKTSDFNHDIEVLRKADGLLIAYRKDQQFELEQVEIDKDCIVNAGLQREYLGTVLDICSKRGIKVLWIRRTDTAHGAHFYIKISPRVGAMTANNLQYLLGDDSKRVGFNKARIESGLAEWSKLFERASCRMTSIYRAV